jgi:hypothetical protein
MPWDVGGFLILAGYILAVAVLWKIGVGVLTTLLVLQLVNYVLGIDRGSTTARSRYGLEEGNQVRSTRVGEKVDLRREFSS